MKASELSKLWLRVVMSMSDALEMRRQMSSSISKFALLIVVQQTRSTAVEV